MKTKFILFFLILACLPLFFIGIRDVHAWGDDYAQYIREAKNISEGKRFDQSAWIFNELNSTYAPPAYPAGFPLLLSPVVKYFGLEIRPMLYLISFILSLLLFVLYFYFQKFMYDISAVCLAICVVYSGCVLNLKWHILSDIPFLFFTSFYLLLRNKERFDLMNIILLSLIALMAILTRSQGFILIAAEGLVFFMSLITLLRKGKLKVENFHTSVSIRVIVITCFCYFILSRTVFSSPGMEAYYANLLVNYPEGFWKTIGNNCIYLLELLKTFPDFNYELPLLRQLLSSVGYLMLLFVLVGFISSLKTLHKFNSIFFILCCVLIIQTPVYQGMRYLLPAWPVYMLYLALGIKAVLRMRLKWSFARLAIILTPIYLLQGIGTFNRIPYQSNWTAYNKEDLDMFDYIRKNISPGEIIVFAKPRALELYTGARTINFAWLSPWPKNKEKFDQLGAKYILRRTDLDEVFVDNFFREVPCAIDSIKPNAMYTLYTIK